MDLVHVIERQAEIGAGGGRPVGVVEKTSRERRIGRARQAQLSKSLGRAKGGGSDVGIEGGEALGFAIPSRYVKDFIRNREAFSYDRSNPNSGHNYHDGPVRTSFGTPSELLDGSAAK